VWLNLRKRDAVDHIPWEALLIAINIKTGVAIPRKVGPHQDVG
jgi:hypothetical protein